jgi:hypothetical protein
MDTTLTKLDIDNVLGAKLKYKNRFIWIIIIGIILIIILFVFLILTGYIKFGDPIKGVSVASPSTYTGGNSQ